VCLAGPEDMEPVDPRGAAVAEIQHWIETVHGKKFPGSFVDHLRSGVVLCEIANAIQAEALAKIDSSSLTYRQMENHHRFLTAIKAWGVPAQDCYDVTALCSNVRDARQTRQVVHTLYALNAILQSNRSLGWRGPAIGFKYASPWRRNESSPRDARASGAVVVVENVQPLVSLVEDPSTSGQREGGLEGDAGGPEVSSVAVVEHECSPAERPEVAGDVAGESSLPEAQAQEWHAPEMEGGSLKEPPDPVVGAGAEPASAAGDRGVMQRPDGNGVPTPGLSWPRWLRSVAAASEGGAALKEPLSWGEDQLPGCSLDLSVLALLHLPLRNRDRHQGVVPFLFTTVTSLRTGMTYCSRLYPYTINHQSASRPTSFHSPPASAVPTFASPRQLASRWFQSSTGPTGSRYAFSSWGSSGVTQSAMLSEHILTPILNSPVLRDHIILEVYRIFVPLRGQDAEADSPPPAPLAPQSDPRTEGHSTLHRTGRQRATPFL